MAVYLGNQLMGEYLGNTPTNVLPKQQILTIGTAYEGGYIYYVTGSYPNYSGYIVSNEESTIANTCYGCYNVRVPLARNTSIGSGLTNTNAIVDGGCGGCGSPVGSSPTAAQASLDYTGSGYTDWYLPATGDWQQIFANKSSFNFLTSSFNYWTSTENGTLNDGLYFGYYAKWVNSAQSGSIQSMSKDSGLYFRAVRAFSTY